MKDIKDYEKKSDVAIYCSSLEEWYAIKALRPDLQTTKEYGFIREDGKPTDCIHIGGKGTASKNLYDQGKYTIYPASDFLEDDILEQCKKKYPIGTKYKCPNSNTITEVKGKFFKGSTGNKFTDGYGGYVYYEGKFAEIVEEEYLKQEGIKNYPITKQECKLDLSNTKIWIGDNPELSKKVQEKAFELGYKWSFIDNKIMSLKAIYFYSDKSLSLTNSEKSGWFTSHYFKEIFPTDLGINTIVWEKLPIQFNGSKIYGGIDFYKLEKKETQLTELELPTPIKVIKREESYY